MLYHKILCFLCLGMMLCFLKGWFLHWRVVAWSGNVYVIVSLALTVLIPESPAWLVAKGRIDEALKSLEWINKYQPQPENRVSITSLLLDCYAMIKICRIHVGKEFIIKMHYFANSNYNKLSS